MNFFASSASAERYSLGRPAFHTIAIDRIAKFFRGVEKFENVLDVACGTGLSTVPLLNIAKHVFATDSSEEMIARAPRKDNIHYSLARAEQQPFKNDTFDLITVCSGIHWFEVDPFLFEISRVLKNNGFLVIYDNFFKAEMAGRADFTNWHKEIYLQTFPVPPRNSDYTFNATNLQSKQLYLIGEEEFNNAVSFTKNQLVLYFTSQSNVINSVANGKTSYQEAEAWLNAQLDPFYREESKRTLIFGNWMKFIEKHIY